MGLLQSKAEETRPMMIVPMARVDSNSDLTETAREQSMPTDSSVHFVTTAYKHETQADLSSKKQTEDLARPIDSSIIASAETKPDFASEKEINDLADDDLVQVFTYLTPFDRLIVSEVCRRWSELGRRKWLDVTELDLGPIPCKHIGAIVRLCPNLRSVFAFNKCFDVGTLACLCRASKLSTVKFYFCTFAVRSEAGTVNECFAKIFSANLPQAMWNELVLHGARMDDRCVPAEGVCSPEWAFLRQGTFTRSQWAFSAAFMPASLTRLQVSGFHIRYGTIRVIDHFLDGLEQLQSLECLMLHQKPSKCGRLDEDLIYETLRSSSRHICEKIGALKNLKELCLAPVCWFTQRDLGRLISSLPKLHALFLNDIDCDDIAEVLRDLITKNSVLRVLILSGTDRPPFSRQGVVQLPPRKRFPNGLDADPLPLLHVFVGRKALEKFRFSTTTSASDAAVFYRIDKPMPDFLAREDIAPIFEGVWFAEKIKETARIVGKLKS